MTLAGLSTLGLCITANLIMPALTMTTLRLCITAMPCLRLAPITLHALTLGLCITWLSLGLRRAPVPHSRRFGLCITDISRIPHRRALPLWITRPLRRSSCHGAPRPDPRIRRQLPTLTHITTALSPAHRLVPRFIHSPRSRVVHNLWIRTCRHRPDLWITGWKSGDPLLGSLWITLAGRIALRRWLPAVL